MPLLKSTGRHEVTVKSAQFGESDKATPFVQLGFETAAGESISGWLYLSERAFENSVRTLREAFGFNGDFETLLDQVTGKKCSITVEVEDFEGKPRFKVKWINRVGAAPVKPMSGQDSLLKSLTAKAARVPDKRPAKAASGAKPAARQDDGFPNV